MSRDFLSTQKDFSAGELDAVAIRRDDTDIMKAGSATFRELDIMLSGGFRRRPGTSLQYYGQSVFRIEPYTGAIFDCEFREAEFRARNSSGAVQSVVATWTLAQVPQLRWALYETNMIVVCQSMRPKVIEYDKTSGLWSIRDFAFEAGLNGMLRQPFYRFANKGITMVPNSATSLASGTATFSSAVLDSGQSGVEFKWVGRRMQMTAFLTTTTATFQNLEQLPPSQRCTMNNVNGYRVGDVVVGATNNSEGQIVAINTGTLSLDIVITQKYDGFAFNEKIVSSEASATVSAVSTPAPFAATIWEEAFMSNYRGWPGSVSVDRQRLIFCDFAQLPGAFIESGVGSFEDFEIGVDANSAIFEIVPQRERVLHVAGGSDQFIFTEQTIYFIPISASNPLSPGSIVMVAIGTGGCSDIEPVAASSSLIYMSADNKRVMALRKIGQYSLPYILQHISRYHSQLFVSPIDIAISYGQVVDSNETLHIINSDGTVVVGRYDLASDFVGFAPWSTQGLVTAATALGENVLYAVTRTLPSGAIVQTVEMLDYSKTMDGVITTAVMEGDATLIPFAGATMQRMVNGVFKGEVVIKSDGTVDGNTGAASTQFGFSFTPRWEPFISNFQSGESFGQRLRRRKIKRVAMTVRKAGPFKVKNKDLAGYAIGDNLGEAPPLRDATYVFAIQGREYDPSFTMTQEAPYSLEVLEVGMEVTN